MRIGLFWKIAAGFWLCQFCIIGVIMLLATLTEPMARGGQEGFERRALMIEAKPIFMVLRLGGPRAVDELLASWPEVTPDLISITDAHGAPPTPMVISRRPGDHLMQATATIAGPGGSWRASLHLPKPSRNKTSPVRIGVVWGPFIGFGLVFCGVLAWYLTRPLRSLRRGFDRLAAGDLSVRLGPAIGRRRDEIADLGRDFDIMAARLEQLVGARDRLLHDVSHELRSPLARLQTAVALWRQEPGRVGRVMDRVELETRRLDTLVGELLTLSRAEGAAAMDKHYLDIVELVRAVAADARFEAEPRGVGVEARLADTDAEARETAMVRGNAELLRRALDNVIRNGLRFSRAGQTVRIATRLEKDGEHAIAIAIADQGPGVSPEMLQQMFEPFVRLDEEGHAAGYGLGLAIARRAVLAHGGAIRAENRSEGGLVVTIVLPLDRGRPGEG